MTRRHGRRGRRLLAALVALGAAAAAARAGRRARLEPMLVRGASMRPTLEPGDRVAVAPPTGPPRRGAVVVVRRPGPGGLEVVKRVVGLPGERVRVLGDRLEVDGRDLPEPWLAGGAPAGPARPARLELVLGPGEYLVLGDNRAASTDGRAFGPVGLDHIVGVVRFAYWPPRRLRAPHSAHGRRADRSAPF
jgi:signal peptidase I